MEFGEIVTYKGHDNADFRRIRTTDLLQRINFLFGNIWSLQH